MMVTTKPVTEANEPELVGALIYAASRSPLETIKANVGTYKDHELDVGPGCAAAEAVAGFLRAFGFSAR